MSRNLTTKEEGFVLDWIETSCKTEAYRRNYACNKMSEKTINNNAYMVSKRSEVQERYNNLMNKAVKRSEVTQDMIIQELVKIAFSDIGDFIEIGKGAENFDEETKEMMEKLGVTSQKVIIKNSSEIPKEKKGVIKSIKQGANGIELTIHDKMASIQLLGKHLGMFGDKLEVTEKKDYEDLTDDELDKQIEEKEKELKEV